MNLKELLRTAEGLLRANAKAVAAFVAGLIVSLFLHFGVNIPEAVKVSLDALIVSVIVWLIPNRE
jgi:hypothetical protein